MKRQLQTPISRWRPGIAHDYTEETLVEHLIYATAGMPREWIADRLGVNEMTIAKWRRAPVRKLSDKMEQRVFDLLCELGHPQLRASP